MTSDNQLSTILLLILIGLAIYFLINPYNGFRNVDKIETFDDSSITSNNEQLNYQIVNSQPSLNNSQPIINNDQLSLNNSQPILNNDQLIINNDQPILNNVQPTLNNDQPILNNIQIQDINPLVSQNVLSEIINESSQPRMSYDPVVHLSSSDLVSLPNYDPNDEDFNYTTSDLTSAFIPPLPPGTQPDLVDFKKNNVDKYNAKDFLPKQVNDEWFETDFSLAKYQLNDDKLINTEKYIIGINTVGESLKNATYDIRGTIPNPKFVVSPWNNSTYEPDFNLKPLC